MFMHTSPSFTLIFLSIANLIAHAIRRRGAGLVNVTGVNTQKDFERLIDQTNQNQSSTCFIKGAGKYPMDMYQFVRLYCIHVVS